MKKKYNKIVEELSKNKSLCFKPKTVIEATLIQEELFKLGFKWINSGAGVWRPEKCINLGFYTISDYTILTGNNPSGVLCHLSDFELEIDSDDLIEALSGDSLVREVFNQLSSRIGNLEDELKQANREISKINKIVDRKTLNKKKLG